MSEYNNVSVDETNVRPTAKSNTCTSKSPTPKPTGKVNASYAALPAEVSSSSSAPPSRSLPQQKASISNWLKIGALSAEAKSAREIEANNADAVTVVSVETNEPAPDRGSLLNQFTRSASWLGLRVFSGIEYVGEAVVSTLGLDESAYQDVLDNMTEEEMNRARQVQLEREQEFERVRSVREMRAMEFGVDVEANLPVPTAVAAPDDINRDDNVANKPPLPPPL